MKKSVLFSAAALLGAAGATAYQFSRWQQASAVDLIAGSRIAPTRVGPVEYVQLGHGPVVLVIHGAPGGYDQGFLFTDLAQAGFAVLAPSRPGYLRTPLAVGQTPEEQADALAALLDTLDIQQVALLGVSAGGPIALQFALRHPQRTWGLVLESAVTQAYQPREATAESLLGRLFVGEEAADFLMWIMRGLTRALPRQMLTEFLKLMSTFDEAGITRAADAIMADPRQQRLFQRLIDTTIPLSLRKAGLDNDLAQFAALPRYPLGALNLPALVVHSPADGDVPLSHAEFAAQTIPGAELALFAAAGHLLWIGADADQVAARRLAFLRQHVPAAQIMGPNAERQDSA